MKLLNKMKYFGLGLLMAGNMYLATPSTVQGENIIAEQKMNFTQGKKPKYQTRIRNKEKTWAFERIDEQLRAGTDISVGQNNLGLYTNGEGTKFRWKRKINDHVTAGIGAGNDKENNLIQGNITYKGEDFEIGLGNAKINDQNQLRGYALKHLGDFFVAGGKSDNKYFTVAGKPSTGNTGIKNMNIIGPKDFRLYKLIIATDAHMPQYSYEGPTRDLAAIDARDDIVVEATRYIPDIEGPLHKHGKIATEMKYIELNKESNILAGRFTYTPIDQAYIGAGYKNINTGEKNMGTITINGGLDIKGYEIDTQLNYTPETKKKEANVIMAKEF